MKLGFKIAGAVVGVGAVAGAVTAFVIVNKKDTVTTPPANTYDYNVPGFSSQDIKDVKTKYDNHTLFPKPAPVVSNFVLKKATAITKFEAFLTDLGFGTALTNGALDLTKVVDAFTKNHIAYDATQAMSDDKLGNRFHDVDKFVTALKAMKAKPTYEQVVKIFPANYSHQDQADKVFKKAFGEI